LEIKIKRKASSSKEIVLVHFGEQGASKLTKSRKLIPQYAERLLMCTATSEEEKRTKVT